MLTSVTIQRRQSEIRQTLSELAALDAPSDEQLSKMDEFDREYRSNETRYRAALVAEDDERRTAGAELESREGRQWDDLVAQFEVRQAVFALDQGRPLTGATAEVASELRSQGQFTGVPIPIGALVEQRNTVSSGTPDPISTRPTIDRLFADSVTSAMGGSVVQIPSGSTEWPITTSAISAGWAPSEGSDVAGPTPFTTTDRTLSPDHTLGIQVRVSRKAMKQSGDGLEQAIRRDLSGAMRVEMDRATFLGSGSGGEPTGVMNIVGPTSTVVGAAPTYDVFLQEITAFMVANAVTSMEAVRLLIRPETFRTLETNVNADIQTTEWWRLVSLLFGRANGYVLFPRNIAVSSNALAVPSGSPLTTDALFTTSPGGVAPFYVGLWGAVDMVRDIYSDAQSGGVRLTALSTMDVCHTRDAQIRRLSGLQI